VRKKGKGNPNLHRHGITSKKLGENGGDFYVRIKKKGSEDESGFADQRNLRPNKGGNLRSLGSRSAALLKRSELRPSTNFIEIEARTRGKARLKELESLWAEGQVS